MGNYYHTDWVIEEIISLHIDGLNMDTIYENLVRQIAGTALEKEDNETLKESVERKEQREKLEKEIAKLRKKMHSEKQFNRQIEINTKIKKLMEKVKFYQ